MGRPLQPVLVQPDPEAKQVVVAYGYFETVQDKSGGFQHQAEARFQVKLPLTELTPEVIETHRGRFQTVADMVDELNDSFQPKLLQPGLSIVKH